MLRFSNWQIQRLRDCLRTYHQYQHDEKGRYYTWQDVREAIAEYTGVEIGGTDKKGPRKGAERLRQFVEGINDKANPGQKKYPVPQQATLQAIHDFVTHEDIKLLRDEELEEYKPDMQAPLRLLEYLYQRAGSEGTTPLTKLEGLYHSVMELEGRQVRRAFELTQPAKDGLMQVRETEMFYAEDNRYSDEVTAGTKTLIRLNAVEPSSQREHSGWAILTPEDNLFLFLKNIRNGRNRYYYTLGSDLAPWNDKQVTKLALLVHDFPVEMFDERPREAFREVISEEVTRKIAIFERVGGKRATKKHTQSATVEE